MKGCIEFFKEPNLKDKKKSFGMKLKIYSNFIDYFK